MPQLSNGELAAMAADAARARSAGHPMPSIEAGLRAILSTRTEVERLKVAQQSKAILGQVTEAMLTSLRFVVALGLL